MTGCRGRLPWHVVEMLLVTGVTLTCKCGNVIRGLPKTRGRCPHCGADLEHAEFCWEIADPPRERTHTRTRRRRS
jgi:predicted amidophosphoribosyltransferase